MKSTNKYINILNILSVVFILLLILIKSFIIYENTLDVILVMYYLISGLNIIIAIINLVKKNKKIGIWQLITGIIMISGMIIAMAESIFYTLLFTGIITIGLSIFNLITNKKLVQKKKSKIILTLFLLLIIANVLIIVVPVIKNIININNLKQALSKIEQDEELETYVFEKNDQYIFIDENGNKVSENDYDEISEYAVKQLKIQDKAITVRWAKKANKIYVINSKGEKLFELCNDTIGELVDKELNEYRIFHNFWTYILENEIFGMSEDNTYLGFEEYKANENVLNKYNENMSKYEDSKSEDIEYKYFQNKEFSDNILQVVINKREIEKDEKLKNIYLENSNMLINAHNLNIRQTMAIYDSIEEFYTCEKEYYLINPNDNTKKQLECDNLIYQEYYDINNELQENILVYESGEIPYYDNEETGYFTLEGEKNTINSKYVIQEITGKYIIAMNTDTTESHVFDKETNELIAKYESLAVYRNCYVSYVKERKTDFIESGKYKILDKEFNSITEYESNKEPIIYKENMILCSEGEHYVTGNVSENQEYCYFFDGEKFNLLDDIGDFEFQFMNNKYNTSEFIYNFDNSIYSKIGVISMK